MREKIRCVRRGLALVGPFALSNLLLFICHASSLRNWVITIEQKCDYQS